MDSDKKNTGFEKPIVDEEHLMNVISGDEPAGEPQTAKRHSESKRQRKKQRTGAMEKVSYKEVFLVNRYPSGRSGKVVYIRPEYHERLLRIVQLTREEKTTLYSYIDNILEYHFREFGADITDFFNDRFKPIL